MTGAADGPLDFVRRHTAVASPPLVPELRLHLATEITPIWEASEDWLAETGIAPPYWAFCWPGGQALARHVLDAPEIVAGRRVLDFAAGCGVAAIAAARAGAEAVANDIDALACAAVAENARLNGVTVGLEARDLVAAGPGAWDVVLAGDVCYERPMAERAFAWLRALADGGAMVLLGDPGRAYRPEAGLEAVAEYAVPTSLELEDREVRETTVWRVVPG